MRKHRVYYELVRAVKRKELKEPFTIGDFREACPNFGEGTYNAFLYKHRKGNPEGNTELVVKVARGKFELLRPFKYEL